MLKSGIVTGSTRPCRENDAVARWVLGIAKQRDDAMVATVRPQVTFSPDRLHAVEDVQARPAA